MIYHIWYLASYPCFILDRSSGWNSMVFPKESLCFMDRRPIGREENKPLLSPHRGGAYIACPHDYRNDRLKMRSSTFNLPGQTIPAEPSVSDLSPKTGFFTANKIWFPDGVHHFQDRTGPDWLYVSSSRFLRGTYALVFSSWPLHRDISPLHISRIPWISPD